MTATDTLGALGAQRAQARQQVTETTEALRVAVLAAVAEGMPESHAAAAAGVDRMTVRKWKAQA